MKKPFFQTIAKITELDQTKDTYTSENPVKKVEVMQFFGIVFLLVVVL